MVPPEAFPCDREGGVRTGMPRKDVPFPVVSFPPAWRGGAKGSGMETVSEDTTALDDTPPPASGRARRGAAVGCCGGTAKAGRWIACFPRPMTAGLEAERREAFRAKAAAAAAARAFVCCINASLSFSTSETAVDGNVPLAISFPSFLLRGGALMGRRDAVFSCATRTTRWVSSFPLQGTLGRRTAAAEEEEEEERPAEVEVPVVPLLRLPFSGRAPSSLDAVMAGVREAVAAGVVGLPPVPSNRGIDGKAEDGGPPSLLATAESSCGATHEDRPGVPSSFSSSLWLFSMAWAFRLEDTEVECRKTVVERDPSPPTTAVVAHSFSVSAFTVVPCGGSLFFLGDILEGEEGPT